MKPLKDTSKGLKFFLPLLGFLFLYPSPTDGTEVKFNFPPPRTNIEVLTPEEIKAVLPNVDGIKGFNCSQKGCYIELNPVLVDIEFKGFSIFSLPRLERYLGLKPYYRYSLERLSSVAGNVVFFLKNNGYLSPTVKTRIFVDNRGFAKLTIYGNEGELYLLGGFLFQTNRSCFSKREFLDEFKKPLGVPFSMLDLYRSLEISEDLCRKKNPFYRVYVFYSEPFEVKRESIFHFFWENFRISPFKGLDFLAYYTDILISNPYRGVKFLFKKAYAVYPKILIHTSGENLKITLTGNKFFSTEFLKREIKKLVYTNGFVSLEDILNLIRELYRDSGFFDVKISIEKRKNRVKIVINEGKRYRVIFIIKPSFGFKPPEGAYYSKKLIKKFVNDLKKYLKKRGFYFKKVETAEVIDRDKKLVKVFVFIADLKPLKVEKTFEISVPDKGLREKIGEILGGLNPKELVFNPQKGKEIARRIKQLLEEYGCIKPISEFKIVEKKNLFEVVFRVSCKGKRRFGKTVYWIEGRIPKREIDYMVVNLEGKRFNPKYLDLLRYRFEKTQLFENLSVIPVKVGNETIPLVWGRERRPFSVEGWLGFTSDEGYSGSVNLKFYDLLRMGETITTSFSLTQKRTLYSVDYFDNYLFSGKTFGGLGIFKRWEEHRDYKLSSKGFSITLGYHLNWWVDFSINLLKGHYTVIDTFKGGDITKLSLTGEINYPIYSGSVRKGTFNGYFNYGISLNKANYSKFKTGGVVSLFWGRFYTSFKGAFGIVSDRAPIFEKFYLGGLKDLKGYGYESVAPYGGGDIFWYTGLEVGFPVKKPLYLFTGADFGNSVKKSENPFKDFKKDIFVGGGVVTAMGPIRVIVATPLEGKISLTNLKFGVLIGFTF